ncbi:hypothetical protein AURDEDRAFT_178619 [Auricularia subglabra TFB-10046 SS5]|uniref:ABC-transporter extension domain-containing protein n=1 Tax=Auricularia subglabra (strain TFB-10046 / SS5) TaxID=717982 RepID=J0CQ37_AURST|nr:hypothetical protein AURDEDRAFT_178619 [Auricularia subglabra TFB-10046 SS5]
MDTVCTNIMDLTFKKKLVYYTGNYSTYVRTKTENEVNQMKAYAKQQEEIAHIKKFIASGGTAGTTNIGPGPRTTDAVALGAAEQRT